MANTEHYMDAPDLLSHLIALIEVTVLLEYFDLDFKEPCKMYYWNNGITVIG